MATIDRRSSDHNLRSPALLLLLICMASACLLELVFLYGNALRDPRYLDGWILAGGMGLQIYFHIAVKCGWLSAKSAKRWRKLHIYTGLALIAVFFSHTQTSLPDTSFEWALWLSFVLITLSGLVGILIASAIKAARRANQPTSRELIQARLAELARDVEAVLPRADSSRAPPGLPGSPDDIWTKDLYDKHLKDYFAQGRFSWRRLNGGQKAHRSITYEIDHLAHYASASSKERLAAIRKLVEERRRLDAAYRLVILSDAWPFIHVPLTYALTVLTVLHVLVVYAFASGAW
ncbi:MAG: hypothetical protein KDJ17_04465 [Hyphomicrobiaceae bacterium]|nr:hypothetical protein [Hyphomicrobiaceae bacterium]